MLSAQPGAVQIERGDMFRPDKRNIAAANERKTTVCAETEGREKSAEEVSPAPGDRALPYLCAVIMPESPVYSLTAYQETDS